MLSLKVSVAAIIGSCVLSIGCVAAPGEQEGEDTASADEAIIWTNGDGPNFFWAPDTRTALIRLAQQPLINQVTGVMTTTPLLTTPEGRHLLHYVVGCALHPGSFVTHPGYGFSEQGAASLATGWATAPLTDVTQQRWVSACLLATLNANSVSVNIHMIGNNPGLADGIFVDTSKYAYRDGTFFGNIFIAGAQSFACIDPNIPTMCGSTWSIDAQKRICDSSPACGITLLGTCNLHCTTDRSGNKTCYAPDRTVYGEAVSTTLDAVSLDVMYRYACTP